MKIAWIKWEEGWPTGNHQSSVHFMIKLGVSVRMAFGIRSFLINKNLSFYFWLKKKIGKKWAFRVANAIENTILLFGREIVPRG